MRSRSVRLIASIYFLFLAAIWRAAGQSLDLLSAAAGVEMSVQFGFEGLFRPGYWTPVRVTAVNHGTPLEARVYVVTRHGGPISTLSHTTSYVETVYLPSEVPITVETDALITNVVHPLRVELHDAQGRVLAATSVDLQRGAVDGAIVLAFDPGGSAWSWLAEELGSTVTLRGQRAGVQVAYVRSPQEVPASWLAYHGVTAVAISASFPMGRLSEAQQEALVRWVEAGGTLIWSGGFRTDAAHSPLLDTLSPVRPTGRIRRIPPEPASAYPAFPRGVDLVAWEGMSAEGTVILETDGVPLIARRRIGLGSAFYVAFDPQVVLQAGWTGLGQLARDAFAAAGALPADLGESADAAWDYVRNVPLPQPPRRWPALLSAGYILALTAATFAVQRKRRGAVALIGTMIGIAAVFSVAGYSVLAPAAAHSRHHVSELALTLADANGYGLRWLLHAVHSWTTDRWAVDAAPAGWTQEPLIRFTGTATLPAVVIDRSGTATQAELPPGSVGRFKAVEPAQLAVAASLELRGGMYRLSVVNQTAWPVSLLYYVSAGSFVSLGRVAPGDVVTLAYPAVERIGSRPSPSFVGNAVGTDILRRHRASPYLASLIGALVTQRARSGPGGDYLDEGFLVGVIDAPPRVTFSPTSSTTSTHVFVMDVRL